MGGLPSWWASIGNVGLNPATIGWTDHVVTPVGGTALMIAEDVLDRFLVQWVERRTRQPAVRVLSRLLLIRRVRWPP